MSVKLRLLAAALLAAAALPAAAQTPAEAPDPVAEARALIEGHKVNTKTGCGLPIPATWNAPPWEQEAAMRRRQAFNRCLDDVMAREQDRLQELTYRVDDIRMAYPDADWSDIDYLLDAKWEQLSQVESKLAIKENWANTAVEILDTFTGPGAPFDSSPLNPTRNPYGYPSYSTGNPYAYPTGNPYAYPYYRRDSSVSAPGIK